MTTIDIERIKQEIPIETLIGQSYTVTGKGHTLTTAEHDSLKIFTHNNSWTWYSQAGRDGKALGGSVIDWYMHMHGCSIGEAIRALGAMLDGGAIPAMPKPRSVKPSTKPPGWKRLRWQRDAAAWLDAAQTFLYDTDDPASAPGREYLAKRGITLEMAIAFGMGFADAWNIKARRNMPALLVPWMNRQITAIQYRFISVGKDDETADRFGQLKGGERLLFGLQHCLPAEPGQLQTLFLVEGELNAVSVFQAAYGQFACDVLSFGPRSNIGRHNQQVIAKVAQRYRHVIVWADEPADALNALGTIPNALPVRSPMIDGKEHDANDLLKAGLLDDVLFDLIRMPANG